ncbi:MAG: N-acetylglucosamine-6-phosphate deacetylase, partial [Rhodobacteraceae bacterium]|nr:N-acetylglucosamine-6-phosphate deacetylase [Paracoccaceae bacterium]
GRIAGLVPDTGSGLDLRGGILAPGFVDLQVNGGGGALLGQGDPDAALAAICAAHAGLGTTGLLPTLITADPDTTQAVIQAGLRAARTGLPGFLGLHLEGPHLDPRRKGAHDRALIRPMTDADLAQLTRAAQDLPALMVTLAPEAATPAQIATLAAAGAVVSLGHSDCTEDAARAALDAGARAVTHLYNAMSPLAHRAPGLVGAALDSHAAAGIIADGVHVAPTAFRLAARLAAGRLHVVTDAMAVAGSDLTAFTLNGRRIRRGEGRLTLDDGTLAGADITLPQSLRWITHQAGLTIESALAMMTRIPATLIGATDRGRLVHGARADLVHLSDELALTAAWRAGVPLPLCASNILGG